MSYIIKTERLGLRNWKENDLKPFAEMCADEQVMEFFPATWSLQETAKFIESMQAHFDKLNYCYFAVDRLDTNEFIGFIGLKYQTYKSHFTPSIDIGWRLKPAAWGNGFATEGAKACLEFAFAELHLEEVYSITPKLNKKSQRVMQKIGMKYHSDFNHPKIDINDPLSSCVVYRVLKKDL